MNLQTGRKLWVVATTVIIAFTIFIVGRNAVHAVKIKRQINALQREKELFNPMRLLTWPVEEVPS